MGIMELINEELLNRVSGLAKESPRLRMNFNFHKNLEAKAQRLLNALEPGTLLPIHRHRHTAETYILIRGKIKVIFYDNEGKITEEATLDPKCGKYGINIPENQWHTIDVLESGSVIFEVKDGPYSPISPEDMLEK